MARKSPILGRRGPLVEFCTAGDVAERRELGAMDAILQDDFLYFLKLPVTFQGKSLCLLVPYTCVEDQVFFEPRDLLLWLGYAEVITTVCSAHCTPPRILHLSDTYLSPI